MIKIVHQDYYIIIFTNEMPNFIINYELGFTNLQKTCDLAFFLYEFHSHT